MKNENKETMKTLQNLLYNSICFMKEQNLSKREICEYLGKTETELSELGIEV